LLLLQEGEETSAVVSAELQLQGKQKQVMAIAYGPGKQLLSTGFMLWMSGSSIQIFSIMMTGMALMTPINGILNLNGPFQPFSREEGIDLKLPKLIYLSLHILGLAMALYKTHTMGLLPVTSADWTSYIPDRNFVETSSIPL
jgi:hypothetical protein